MEREKARGKKKKREKHGKEVNSQIFAKQML